MTNIILNYFGLLLLITGSMIWIMDITLLIIAAISKQSYKGIIIWIPIFLIATGIFLIIFL